MVNLDVVGYIIKGRANNQSDDSLMSGARDRGYAELDMQDCMKAIDADEIFVVRTLWFLTPISPIFYTFGTRKVSKQRNILWGLMKDNDEIGIRTIDNVRVEQGLITATVIIVHSDKSEVHIDKISRADAKKIDKFFSDVIECQRAKVVNIAQD
jgi:hypothetical protein